MASKSIALEGLRVSLDELVYQQHPINLPASESHAFIYFLTITNLSDRTVRLLGRKWLITNEDGTKLVIEGDKIVGETPVIDPGEHFTYNSYHVTNMNAVACGSLHGVDQFDQKVHVRIPEFELSIPEEDTPDFSLS
ncbi:MAG: ApaG domain [Opitutales bacterium]